MSFLTSNFYTDFFFRKEEPAPEPAKPPNIFGGLAVKSAPYVIKSPEKIVSAPKTQSLYTEKIPEINKFQSKDPFEELQQRTVTEKEKIIKPVVEKKNDVNSIEFLLDLTMPQDEHQKSNTIPVQNTKEETRKRTFVNKNLYSTREIDVNEDKKIIEQDNKNHYTYTTSHDNQTEEKLDHKYAGKNELDHQNEKEIIQDNKSFNENNKSPKSQSLVTQKEEINPQTKQVAQETAKESKFRKQIEEKKRKEQEAKERLEIEKMQKEIEEKRKQDQISNPSLLKESLDADLRITRELITNISTEQCTINEVQNNLEQTIEEMKMQVKELENSANEAANNEDFELAANYSDQLEDIKMKILFTIKEYEKISENYLELEFKKSEAYLKQENTLLDYKEKTNNIKEIITNSIRDNQQELETIEKNKNQFIESKKLS